jgi:hypothetical protein
MNDAMNSAINMVNAAPTSGSNNTLYLALVGLAIVGIIYIYVYNKKPETSTPYLSETGALHVTPQVPPTVVTSSHSWCLVAEDMSGRYCVKVPGPDSCEPGRTYSSQSDCELTPAMRLPAGIQQDSGMKEKPFRDVKVR